MCATRLSRIPIKVSTLMQIAGGVFVAGSTSLYFLQRRVQNKVRELPHFQETFKIINEHKELLSRLGTPIQVGRVDLANRKLNYVDVLESRLCIPISGPIDSGFVKVLAVRKDENEAFVTKQLEFETEEGSYLFYQI